MKKNHLSQLVDLENPQHILDEVKTIVSLMFSDFDFDILDRVFKDVLRLFRGEYPGYRGCNTEYHDLNHATDTFLTMARIMHSVFLSGESFTRENVPLGLICALMHDTGYIQTTDDFVGTGAKYTRNDTKRSTAFMGKYLADNGFSLDEFENYAQVLQGAALDVKISEIQFVSKDVELLCKMLGTADLTGQMADRIYLEKLLFLFYEFREGAIDGYDTELELLRKTFDFYTMIRERFATELGSINECLHLHFKARWNIDQDLYGVAIEKNLSYLKFILKNHMRNYRDHLRRGGVVRELHKRSSHEK